MPKKKLRTPKQRSAEAKEIIETIGQEGRKGVEAAKSYFKEQDKKNSELEAVREAILENARRKKKDYNTKLAYLLLAFIYEIPWTTGWKYHVAPTDEGVVLELEAPGPRYFRTAFKSVGIPKVDINAVKTFALRAENTFDKHNKSQIILP